MDFHEIKDWESLLTVLALVSGALFFGWKIIAGWLIANLDVAIEVQRQAKNEKEDWLAVKILLKKGNMDSMWLKQIVIKIYDPDDKKKIDRYYIKEFERLENIEEIENTKQNKKQRHFAISPGETFQFGKIITVDLEKPFIIEVALTGKRPFWKGFAQWRSTTASLPIVERKNISHSKR